MSGEEEFGLETVDIEVETLPQETEPETSLFSSSDYNNEELVRLVELQRRHTEMQNADIDGMDALDNDEEEVDDDDSDDFSVHGSRPKGPPVPDMRFEKQFEKAVFDLREKGHGRLGIFWSAVVKDQIIIPFVSGFAWSICSTAWKWYRVRGKVTTAVSANKEKASSFSFLRGLKYGFANWLRNVYNAILRNTGALRPALGS